VRASVLQENDIEKLISYDNANPNLNANVPLINATGKKILLIDDEADKGWRDVLKGILKGASFETISERVRNYEAFTDNSRKKIETGDYDLIFLDLRLGGIDEEKNVQPEDFSGMKVLKAIKEQNKGTQVIMLTASNKAWNMKALLDAGADGYYIKESPEYAFSTLYSQNNAENLCKTIERCLSRGYLRNVYTDIGSMKQWLETPNVSGSLRDNVSKQLDIAFYLISRAQHKQEFAFAYVTLEQIFEIVSKEFIIEDRDNPPIIKELGKKCKNWEIKGDYCIESKKPIENNYPQWKKIVSIYSQLFDEDVTRLGVKIRDLIDKRNAFIHNNEQKRPQKKSAIGGQSLHQDIFTEKGFNHLFYKIEELIDLISSDP